MTEYRRQRIPGSLSARHSVPANLAYRTGLIVWFATDSLPTAVDGDAIASWTDWSSGGHDVTQGTAAAKPTFRAKRPSDFPLLQFDGGDSLACASHADFQTQDGHFFIVGALYGGTLGYICGDARIDTDRYGVAVWKHTTGLVYGECDSNAGYQQAHNGSTTNNEGRVRLWEFAYDAVSLRHYMNGGALGSPVARTIVIAWNNHAFGIGAAQTGTAYGGTMFLAEVLWFNAALSDGNRAIVEDYLNRKYKLW